MKLFVIKNNYFCFCELTSNCCMNGEQCSTLEMVGLYYTGSLYYFIHTICIVDSNPVISHVPTVLADEID